MTYSTIFFDWGGVIANDPGDDFLKKLLVDIGASETQIQEIFMTYMYDFMRGTISERDYWQSIHDRYGLTIHEDISDDFKKWQGLNANQAILDLAQSARVSGMKIAILSNVIEPTYNVLAQAGYYDLFDDVIASCKVGYAKPDVEIYQLALDRLDATADKAIFIDDKVAYLEPAKALGFATVHAQNPAQIITDIKALMKI